MLGAIEAGGTKFVCAVSNSKLEIIDKISIKTTTPYETLNKVFLFFSKYKIKSLCIGSFGPINLNKNSKDYGYIGATPKLDWVNFNILKNIEDHFNIPVTLNTDVNIAAYGELINGVGIGKNNLIYLTVGTGIGGGVIINKEIINTEYHPEIGHMFIQQNKDDNFLGNCPYHSNCLEGLAAGPSIQKRWGEYPIDMNEEHIAWEFESEYLAQAAINCSLSFAPDMIIFGGGVMHKKFLINKIKQKFLILMNNYIHYSNIDNYIVTPKLKGDAGIIGALLLAKRKII